MEDTLKLQTQQISVSVGVHVIKIFRHWISILLAFHFHSLLKPISRSKKHLYVLWHKHFARFYATFRKQHFGICFLKAHARVLVLKGLQGESPSSSFTSASGTLLLGMNTFCSLQCNTSEIETTRLFSPITWQNFHVPVDEFKPCSTEISRKTFPRPVNNRTFMYQSTSSTTNEVWTEESRPRKYSQPNSIQSLIRHAIVKTEQKQIG